MTCLINVTKNCFSSIHNKLGEVRGFISSTFNDSRLGKIAKSIVGWELIRATAENIAEYVGYYSGGMVCAPIGKKIGGMLLGSTGKAASVVLTLLAAGKSTEVVYSKSKNVGPTGRRLLACALNFALVAYLTHLTCFENFALWGESIGKTVGEFLAYILGGILTAFLAIKKCKSSEILWGPEIIKTYPFKTIQSMGVCALASYYGYLPSEGVLASGVNFIAGSLVYNALDILNFLKSALNGTLLKEVPLYTWLESCVSSIVQLIGQEIESRLNSSPLFPLLFDQRNPNSLVSYFIHKFVFNMLIRSFNLYFYLLSTCPDVLQNYDKNPQEAQRIIDIEIKKIITSLKMNQVQLNFINSFSGTEKYFSLLDSHRAIQGMTEHVMNSLSTLEKKGVGFEVLSAQKKEKAKEKIRKHWEGIFRLLPSVFPLSVITECDEVQIRAFYKNITFVLSDHYQEAVGKVVAKGLKRCLDYQITHS